MSKVFIIKSNRKDEKTSHTITFNEGRMVSDKREKNPKGLHGSEISFIPNKKYLGKDAHIDMPKFIEWIESNSYLLSSEKKKITTLVEVWKGTKILEKKKFVARPFADMLKKICKKPVSPQIDITKRGKVDNIDFGGKHSKKDLLIQVSFAYDGVTDNDQPVIIDSYCNYTNTTDGGVHVDTTMDAICRFLHAATKASLTEKEKEKMDILWSDIKTDLRVDINLNSNANVQFAGNQKQKIIGETLIQPIKELVTAGLQEYFDKHVGDLQVITKIIKANAKARIELTKIKSVNTKVKTNNFTDYLDPNFTACNNKGKQYKEIYMVEGQRSAAGSVVNARNYDVQAVLGFRGVTANAYKRDITTIFENAEWKNYCMKIHYDIKSGNVSTVYYNKIIIATDADTDGDGIAAGITAFHAKFARPIVEAGMLYRVYPPLYHIDDKGRPFVRNKRELLEVYMDKLVSAYKMILSSRKQKDPLKKSEFKQFIYDTERYLEELEFVAAHYAVNRTLVEIVGYNLIMYAMAKFKSPCTEEILTKALNDQKFITKLMNEIQIEFPEITISGNLIKGVIDGKFQALTIKMKFIEKMSVLTDIFLNYGIYVNYAEKSNPYISATIGEFLSDSTKYTPKILERYKGLGEANHEDLADTIMDPSRRILIRLTLDDVDRDLKMIEMLMSGSAEARRARKKMMREYVIHRDDIDN